MQAPAREDEEAEARPAWHWILIGAAFIVAFFLPLAIPALWISARLAERAAGRAIESALLAAGPVFAAFVLAALASGALVGRFGRGAGLSGAALSGAIAGVVLTLFSALGGSLTSVPLAFVAVSVLSASGAGSALLGALLGRKNVR